MLFNEFLFWKKEMELSMFKILALIDVVVSQ